MGRAFWILRCWHNVLLFEASNLVFLPFVLWHLAFTAVCLVLSLFVFSSPPPLFLSRFIRYVGVSSPEVQHGLTHMSQQYSLSTGCNDHIDRACSHSCLVQSWLFVRYFLRVFPFFGVFSLFLAQLCLFSRSWLSLLDNSLPSLLMQFPTSREQLRSLSQSDFLANIFQTRSIDMLLEV